MHTSRNSFSYFRKLRHIPKIAKNVTNASCYYATTIDLNDVHSADLLQKQNTIHNSSINLKEFGLRFYKEQESRWKEISDMTLEELENFLLKLMLKNKDKQIKQVLLDCCKFRKLISEATLKKLLTNYSESGKPEYVVHLQKYCEKVNPHLYNRNGEFMHYLAKAQCFKGNSEKGLLILQNAYKKHISFRSTYRLVFRELIQDSVANRSEASLVIFRNYVLKFSTDMKDHYPMVCLWHICWSSNWFSDQMLSNELLESSKILQDIVKDRATAFSITILRGEFNEDAVVRLLQFLLKYKMMAEYLKVLQVLFNFKLRNGDVRGCTEIIRHCETLGLSLTSNQQGRFIRMLINGNEEKKPKSVDFELKF